MPPFQNFTKKAKEVLEHSLGKVPQELNELDTESL